MSFFFFLFFLILTAFLFDKVKPEFEKAREELFLEASNKLKTQEFIVLDLETTGLNRKTSEIIEIGAFLVQNCEIIDQFHSFVKPLSPIPGNITKITGITNKKVEKAPGIESVMPQFIDFIGNRVCVAHNASFDQSFLKKAAKGTGVVFQNSFIDTLKIARVHYPFWPNHQLPTLVDQILPPELKKHRHHSGLEDARILSLIFIHFLNHNQVLLSDSPSL